MDLAATSKPAPTVYRDYRSGLAGSDTRSMTSLASL